MNLQHKINTLSKLGTTILQNIDNIDEVIQNAGAENGWFTPENCKLALKNIAEQFLNPTLLHNWIQSYNIQPIKKPKTVGLILAGNIPLVGFHDVLCVILSNNIAQVKLSSKDEVLFKYIHKQLQNIDFELSNNIQIVNKLSNFDAVIATGSDNTARYFQYYFDKYPHIIRKNRTSAAVLWGNETTQQIVQLGDDIFTYFGLGCRNVSKLYVPQNYDFVYLLNNLEVFNNLANCNKYKNNLDYYTAIYLLNKTPHFASTHLLLTQNQSIFSPTSVVYYQYYQNNEQLLDLLNTQLNNLQCIVSNTPILNVPTINLGCSQKPALNQYPDNIDTMQFLLQLNK